MRLAHTHDGTKACHWDHINADLLTRFAMVMLRPRASAGAGRARDWCTATSISDLLSTFNAPILEGEEVRHDFDLSLGSHFGFVFYFFAHAHALSPKFLE